MSDWITKAIKAATDDRDTEREYALLRETTFRRLFPQIRDEIKKQLERDVESYNAHFPNAAAKHVALERELVPYMVTLQKNGDSPTGHLNISFTEESRSISATVHHTSREGDRQISNGVYFTLRLDGESIVVEDEAGKLLSVPDLSRRILEPFFIGVT